MDLTPLYELRERLRACAVAGTALLPGDFRLRRAVEEFAPLAAAVPVFARIGALANELLTAGEAQRAGVLLETLALADAVLCTQGAVAVSGPAEPLDAADRGTAVTNAPYSIAAPLCDALLNSGGGRYGIVLQAREQNPELFRDYRIQSAMVGALGASYAELADNVQKWLIEDGKAVLPLLMRDFHPQGKREMVRRVQVIDASAGAEANDFYLRNLENAVREVRAALIYALRHSEANAGRLLELVKTERGECRKQAHWALARLHAPAAAEYWGKLLEKKPEQAAEFMVLSTTEEASELVGSALLRLIAPYEADSAAPFPEKTAECLAALMEALPGKSGPAVCAFYRRAAALGEALDRPADGGGQTFMLCVTEKGHLKNDYLPFSRTLPIFLRRSMTLNPAADLLALADALYQEWGDAFASAALAARLLRESPEEAYRFARPVFEKKGLFQRAAQNQRAARGALLEALDMVKWDAAGGRQVLLADFRDPASGRVVTAFQPLCGPLDLRWYSLLTDPKISHKGDYNVDLLLCSLIQPGSREVCEITGAYLYHRALLTDDARRHLLPALELCGWERCENLAVSYCRRQKHGIVRIWSLFQFLCALPGDGEARAQETERVLALVNERRLTLNGGSTEKLQEWAQCMRGGQLIDL